LNTCDWSPNQVGLSPKGAHMTEAWLGKIQWFIYYRESNILSSISQLWLIHVSSSPGYLSMEDPHGPALWNLFFQCHTKSPRHDSQWPEWIACLRGLSTRGQRHPTRGYVTMSRDISGC
jgi:hypothetical protein